MNSSVMHAGSFIIKDLWLGLEQYVNKYFCPTHLVLWIVNCLLFLQGDLLFLVYNVGDSASLHQVE